MNASLCKHRSGRRSAFIALLAALRSSRGLATRWASCQIALGHRIVFLLRLCAPDGWRSIALLPLPLCAALQPVCEGLHQPHFRFPLVRASKWSTPAGHLERVDGAPIRAAAPASHEVHATVRALAASEFPGDVQ